MIEVLTVGHSTLGYDQFLDLLRRSGCNAIADVRTAPFSRHFPHFNRDMLKEDLRLDGIAYSFLGHQLGGRPASPLLYRHGVADYEQMAQEPDFEDGLRRVMDGADRYRLALMCSEHDPLDCHRCLLVGRALKERGVLVRNVLSSGELVTQEEIENRLLAMADRDDADLFLPADERLAMAYRSRAMRVAYAETRMQAGDRR